MLLHEQLTFAARELILDYDELRSRRTPFAFEDQRALDTRG
jgi:hypothetical protein